MGLESPVSHTAHGVRNEIFISFSHHDLVWAKRFRNVLKPLVRSKRLQVWADIDIPVGAEWHREIMWATRRSNVALLLVSNNFLASDFIMNEELPALIGQGVRLASVLVGACLWKHVPELERVEWLHKPVHGSALNLVANKRGKRDLRLAEICDRLIAMVPDLRQSHSRDYDSLALSADGPLGYDQPLKATNKKIAYQRTIYSGDTERAPKAAVHLGMLLAEEGDPIGARDAYQVAINSNHVEWAPMAAVYGGALLAERGNPVGARAVYKWVIDIGHVEWAPMAAVSLGILLAEQGDPIGAREAYQQAINSGHKKWAPMAAVYLAMLLAEQGDSVGARAAYQWVVSRRHAEWEPKQRKEK